MKKIGNVKIGIIVAALMLVGGITRAVPASAAELCLQFDGVGCDVSGDIGYFHFDGVKLPTMPRKSVVLHGRVCGGGAAYGTASMTTAGDQIIIAGGFSCDALNGTFTGFFNTPPTPEVGTTTGGYATYSDSFVTGNACTITVVDCSLRPDL